MEINWAAIAVKLPLCFALAICVLTAHAENTTVRNGPAGQILTRKRANTVPDSQMVWGKTTNLQIRNPFDFVAADLKAGIRSSNGVILLAGKPPTLVGRAAVYLENTNGRPLWESGGTNNGASNGAAESGEARILFLPPERETLSVEMSTADDVSVPKTIYKLPLKSPELEGRDWRHWDKDGRQYLALLPQVDYEIYNFDPTRYFTIEKPGQYRLTLVQRVYVIDTNRLLKAVDLPPITVNVRVEE